MQAENSLGRRQRVLTVAVDNHRRTVTQARGRYNLLPSNKGAAPKRVGASYWSLLSKSRQILGLWAESAELYSY